MTTTDRYKLWELTPFEQWLQDEGVHVITDQLIAQGVSSGIPALSCFEGCRTPAALR